MIRHLVMSRWTAEATEEEKQQVAAEFRRLSALLPVLRAYHVGPVRLEGPYVLPYRGVKNAIRNDAVIPAPFTTPGLRLGRSQRRPASRRACRQR